MALHITLDREALTPLAEQIYQAIAGAIRSRRLRAGAPLPSTRALAGDLAVARGTVISAFDKLRAEGYVDATRGRVARVARGGDGGRRPATPQPLAASAERPAVLSARGRRITAVPVDVMRGFSGHAPRAFRSGVPALDVFPVDVWGRLLARAWRRGAPRTLGYGDPRGLLPLREAIARYLAGARGMSCTADQIVICSGSQQAIDLTARVLLDEGDEAWVEDPGYTGTQGALAANGLRVVPVPVDAEGLDVAAGLRLAPGAKLACVTSARQVPLGMAMSAARGDALLAWAERAGAWIFDDDYGGELNFAVRPPMPLQARDRAGCVIHAGTFSKVLFPSLRIGYLVTPRALAEPLARAKLFADIATPHLQQAVLADFITEGHFDRHIRRMRALYQRRQKLLVRLLRRRLGASTEIACGIGGMSLVVWLPPSFDDRAVAEAARGVEIDVLPMSGLTIRTEGKARPGLLLGFGGIRDADLTDGVEKLVALLRRH